MSIRIEKNRCAGCGRCIEACPGNLIKSDADQKAYIRHIRDCWGCTACVKECGSGAIRYFLGADIGGMGSELTVTRQGGISIWQVSRPCESVQTIAVNKNDANKY